MEYIREYTTLSPKERRQLNYKRQYKAEKPSWDDSMVLLTNLVRERLPEKAAVLDFGCGHGNFVLDELGDIFSRKIGLDVGPAETAGNTSIDEFIYTDHCPWPIAERSVDAVISLWVMEHVEDPSAVFADIVCVLKPGGFFAFVTPNCDSLLIRLRRLMSQSVANALLKRLYDREEDDVFGVYYRANREGDLRNLAKHVGLIVEELHVNADPSYTSFNSLSYRLSKLFSAAFPTLAAPHVICVLRKPADGK